MRRPSGKSPQQWRQNVFNRVILIGVLVVVIVLAAYAFTRPTTVGLPDYLNRCLPGNGPFAYQSSVSLALNISGAYFTIPPGIGISGSCLRPISTVDNSGILHIITDVNRTYTLGDFFLLWGYGSGPDYATFNQHQILNNKADGISHYISMDVNGAPNQSFQNFVLPRNSTGTKVGGHFTLINIYYI